MKHVEEMLAMARLKEEQDKDQEERRSEFLDARELQDDDEMKLILQEQEKVMRNAKEHGF